MVSVNAAFRKRKPWRNAGGHGATVKQVQAVRMMERLTGSKEAVLRDMSRADVSDYIAVLNLRLRRQKRST